jgi:phosphatidate cytidylyltransferase
MTRVLSAALLIPLVVGIVWFLPPVATLVLATAASVLAVREYADLAAAAGARVPWIAAAVAVAAACVAVGSALIPLDVVLLCTMVIVGTILVAAWTPGPGVVAGAAGVGFAVVYIGVPLGALAAIRALGGREALLLLMGTIVISDSAQYYTGRAFGRVPLAPAISPKKTREGAIGGVVLGAAAMLAGGMYLFPQASPAAVGVLALLVVAAGITGDLFESLLKRSAGVKDSSTLIPGHGGVLDRLDSWLFAGPVFYLFLRYVAVP